MKQNAAALIRSALQQVAPRAAFRLSRLRKSHDEPEMRLLPLLVDPDREAVDVGANVGRYAYPLAQLARHVHVFEPHPRLARMLKTSLPRNCTVRQVAVSDQTKTTSLRVPAVAGRWDEGLAYLDSRAEADSVLEIEIQTIVLDTIADRPIGFVKIDVEGHEQSVLRGASRLLERHRPTLLVEAEDRHCLGTVQAVFDLFGAHRYSGLFLKDATLFSIAAFRPELQDPRALSQMPDGGRDSVCYINNFIFVPEERRSALLRGAVDMGLTLDKGMHVADADIDAEGSLVAI